MCRSSWESVPTTANEHVHIKDKIYFPRCGVGEPRFECSSNTAPGGQQGWLREADNRNKSKLWRWWKKKWNFIWRLKEGFKEFAATHLPPKNCRCSWLRASLKEKNWPYSCSNSFWLVDLQNFRGFTSGWSINWFYRSWSKYKRLLIPI